MKIYISKKLLLILLILIIIASSLSLYFFTDIFKSPIPPDIKKQLDFSVIMPQSQIGDYKLDKNTVKFELKERVFTFIIKDMNNNLTFTEQAYPEVLIYDKLANSIHPYSEITTKNGKVTLGKPNDKDQVAVLNLNNANTTLIFAKSDKELKDDEWKDIFNSLSEEK